jgi:hypothetical protein
MNTTPNKQEALEEFQAAVQKLDSAGLVKPSYKHLLNRMIVGIASQLKRDELVS